MSLKTGDLVRIDRTRADTVALYAGVDPFMSVQLPDMKEVDVALVLGLTSDYAGQPLAAVLVPRTMAIGWCPGTSVLEAVT